MRRHRITMGEAVKFHGHLGPYLVLGILAGELALKELRCKKYFGLTVKVRGATLKPKSCFIDGLQLSTGATYGKGNITKFPGQRIQALFINSINHKQLVIAFNRNLTQQLNILKGHAQSERFAMVLFKTAAKRLFTLKTKN